MEAKTILGRDRDGLRHIILLSRVRPGPLHGRTT